MTEQYQLRVLLSDDESPLQITGLSAHFSRFPPLGSLQAERLKGTGFEMRRVNRHVHRVSPIRDEAGHLDKARTISRRTRSRRNTKPREVKGPAKSH